MLSFELTEDEKSWFQRKYPGLTMILDSDVSVFAGSFSFDAVYENHRITDSYQVRIEFRRSTISDLPIVRETGTRIKHVAKVKNIDLADLHIYGDGIACLCVKPAEVQYFPDKFYLQKFLEELVVPFFYAQSYFEQNGAWPWETYSHGSLGWLEWYFEQDYASPFFTTEFIQKFRSQRDWMRIHRALTRKGGPKSHRRCLCGGSKSYWNCHQKAFRGLRKLFSDAKSFGIKI